MAAVIIGTSPHLGGNTINTTYYAGIGYARNAFAVTGGVNTTEANYETTARFASTVSEYTNILETSTTQNLTFALVQNGTGSALSVTAGSGTTGTYTDSTHSVSVASGDTLSFSAAPAASCTCPHISTSSAKMVPASGTKQIYTSMGDPGSLTVASTTRFNAPFGFANFSSTESSMDIRIPFSGTASNYGVQVSANTWATDATAHSRINGSNGNQAFTITAGTTGWFEDTTNTDSVSGNADFCLGITTGTGTSKSMTVNLVSCHFDFDGTPTSIIASAGNNGSFSAGGGATTYFNFGGSYGWGGSVNTATDANREYFSPFAGTLTGMFFHCTASPTATLNSRINGVNGNQSFTTSASGWYTDSTNTDSVSVGTMVNAQLVYPSQAGTYSWAALGIVVHPSFPFIAGPSLSVRQAINRASTY